MWLWTAPYWQLWLLRFSLSVHFPTACGKLDQQAARPKPAKIHHDVALNWKLMIQTEYWSSVLNSEHANWILVIRTEYLSSQLNRDHTNWILIFSVSGYLRPGSEAQLMPREQIRNHCSIAPQCNIQCVTRVVCIHFSFWLMSVAIDVATHWRKAFFSSLCFSPF